MRDFLSHLPVIGQVIGILVFLAGLFLLTSLAWTLLAGGIALTALAVTAEMSPRPITRARTGA